MAEEQRRFAVGFGGPVPSDDLRRKLRGVGASIEMESGAGWGTGPHRMTHFTAVLRADDEASARNLVSDVLGEEYELDEEVRELARD